MYGNVLKEAKKADKEKKRNGIIRDKANRRKSYPGKEIRKWHRSRRMYRNRI